MKPTRSQRSPIRVENKPGPFKDDPDLGRLVRFRCHGARLQAARFEKRGDPTWVLILHRSTRRRGHWQLSEFDSSGAIGDRRAKTCDALTKQVSAKRWRLRKIDFRR